MPAEPHVLKRFLNIDDVLSFETFGGVSRPLFDFSPCRTRLAIAVTAGVAARSASPLVFLSGADRDRLHIIDLATGSHHIVGGIDGAGLSSPVWSPDGTRIAAVIADGAQVRLCVVDPDVGTITLLGERDLAWEPVAQTSFRWIDETSLACRLLPPGVQSPNIMIGTHAPQTAMAGWTQARLGRQTTASSWTGKDSFGPQKKADLAIVDVETGRVTCFSDEDAPPALNDFARREITSPTLDSSHAAMRAADRTVFLEPETGATLDISRSNTGTKLRWRADRDTAPVTLLDLNTHLQDVVVGEMIDLDYTLANGQSAMTRCVLPPDWCPGQRRPAVMFVYPELKRTPISRAHRLVEGSTFIYNAHLFAAQGYVVLEPNLPFDPKEDGEIIASLAAGVGPALEAAAAAGFIDLADVHVYGQSAGGWAVMALLATTKFFRSGVSMAGISDLLALHGQSNVALRYMDPEADHHPLMDTDPAAFCEGFFHLPGPPWRHADSYMRNSPLFHVEAIEAPLLLMHGDLDFVSIRQSEAMFQALRRLGKPVEIVRYWGENHTYDSPANLRDAFARIVAWLQGHGPIETENPL